MTIIGSLLLSYQDSFSNSSVENKIKDIVIDIMGKEVSDNGNSSPTVVSIATKPDNTVIVVVRYPISSYSVTRIDLWKKTMNFTKQLYREPSCSSIKRYTLIYMSFTTDMYGNRKEVPLGQIELDRSTANKIHWENINSDMFYKVAKTDGRVSGFPPELLPYE